MELQGFLAAGVNYKGGKDIKGDYGKVIKTSLKFEISGESKQGYDKVGIIAMSLYKAGAPQGTETASFTLPDLSGMETA